MSHTFPALPYPYDALEPYIDAKTMEVHYSKHHKTYFDKFVTAVQGSELETQSLDEIFAAVSQHSPAIRNNAGGYYNHILYWNCMSPEGGGEPQGALAQAINDKFGHFEKFKDEFAQAAVNGRGRCTRRAYPCIRCVGARVLHQLSEPSTRIHRRLVECGELARRRRKLRSRARVTANDKGGRLVSAKPSFVPKSLHLGIYCPSL